MIRLETASVSGQRRAAPGGGALAHHAGEGVLLLLLVGEPVRAEHVAQHVHFALQVDEPVLVQRLDLLEEGFVDDAQRLGYALAHLARLGRVGVLVEPDARVEQLERGGQIVAQEGAQLGEQLRTLPPVTIYEPEYVEAAPEAGDPRELTIEHLGNTWVITGVWLERMVENINFDDYESRNHFDALLRKAGLFARLEEMGIADGDTVDIYDIEFEYQR